jgi:hypothetical protein
MLAEHRVLTTTHLTALAFTPAGTRRAQRRLHELADMGVIDSFRPIRAVGSAPAHWVTTPVAFAVLAAEDDRPHNPTTTKAPHRGVARGLALAHNQQLRHQLGVNTCLTDLVTTSSDSHTRTDTPITTPGRGRVDLWWGQARCQYLLAPARPDAYLVWTDLRSADRDPMTATAAPVPTEGSEGSEGSEGRGYAFALEYDTGSETLARLAGKLAGYHALALATAIRTTVLFWLPTPARETNARHTLARALGELPYPDLVPIATAHPHPQLPGRGWHPHAPIWRPLTANADPTPCTDLPTTRGDARGDRATSLAQHAYHAHSLTSTGARLAHRTHAQPNPSDTIDTPDTGGPAPRTTPSQQLWVAPPPLAPAPSPVRLRRR